MFSFLSAGTKFNSEVDKQVKALFQPTVGQPDTLANPFGKLITKGSPLGYTPTSPEDEATFREEHGIEISDPDAPCVLKSFNELSTRFALPTITKAVEKIGWSAPTPVQMACVPVILDGRDVIATAPTGSGKTAAVLIPLIAKLRRSGARKGFRAVIVVPTRELASQTMREFEKLSALPEESKNTQNESRKLKALLLSGSKHNFSSGTKVTKYDVLITTPLRLFDFVNDCEVSFQALQMLVLDEADRLFETRFLTQMDALITTISGGSHNLVKIFFSATMPKKVRKMANSMLVEPVEIKIGAQNASSIHVEQELKFVGDAYGKLYTMRQILRDGIQPPCIVFVETKERAAELFRELAFEGYVIDTIHADRSAAQRQAVLNKFRRGEIWVLICTDLMARGIDFKGIRTIINYDIPTTPAAYVHRVGRAGRQKKGKAITFFCESEAQLARNIAQSVKDSGGIVPDWLMKLKPSHGDKYREALQKRDRKSLMLLTSRNKQKDWKKVKYDRSKSKMRKKKLQHKADNIVKQTRDRNVERVSKITNRSQKTT